MPGRAGCPAGEAHHPSSSFSFSQILPSSSNAGQRASFVLRSSFAHARNPSTSSTSTVDSIKELPADDRPASTWAGEVAQSAPALTYRHEPSTSSLSSASATEIYDAYPAVPARKRFKAPMRSQLFDRAAGNVSPPPLPRILLVRSPLTRAITRSTSPG